VGGAGFGHLEMQVHHELRVTSGRKVGSEPQPP